MLSQQRRQMPIAISTVAQWWRHPPLLLRTIYRFPTCLSPPHRPTNDGVRGATATATTSAYYRPDVEPVSEVEDGDDDIALPDKPSSSPQKILTRNEFQAALHAHCDFAALLSRELRTKYNLINKCLKNIEKQADKLDECKNSLQCFYASHITIAFAGDSAAQHALYSASDSITANISKRKLAIPKPRHRKYTKTTDKKLWIHPLLSYRSTHAYMYIYIFMHMFGAIHIGFQAAHLKWCMKGVICK